MRAYGSIPHLPGSRTGPADRHLDAARAAWCVDPARALDDAMVTVQEKLDGSCVAVLREGDTVRALGREGRLASASPNAARRMFARWVEAHRGRFLALLGDGERAVGEWLALAHGTRYALTHEPFVVFDLMRGAERALVCDVEARAGAQGFSTPHALHRGAPLPVADALAALGERGFHGAADPAEGVVYRVERAGSVGVVAKHVRHGKADGRWLPENTGLPALWNHHDGVDDGPDLHHFERPQGR